MNLIVLDATTKKLQLVLGEAATTELDYTASWADSTATDVTEGNSNGTSNDTTAVDIVAAPAASTRRIIKDVSVYNNDNISHTFTINYNDNGTTRKIWTGTLTSGSIWYLSRVLSAGGGSPLTTQGDIYVYDTGNTRLAKGTASQQLRMNAGGTMPEWFTPGGAASFWTLFSGAYASGTTLTVAGVDMTGIFKKGVIIKLLSSANALKVVMVASSSFSTDTTVNVIGSTLASGDKDFYYGADALVEHFIIPGTIAAGTDIAKTWYCPTASYPIGCDAHHKTAGTTNATEYDINDDGTSLFNGTAASIATTATVDLNNAAYTPTTVIAADSAITVDVNSISTTAPVEAYIDFYYFPQWWISRT